MQARFHNHRSYIIFMVDMAMVIFAWISTLFLCFNFNPPFTLFFYFLPYIIIIQALSFYLCGLYRGIWRFASIPDLVRIFKAVILSIAAMLSLCYLQHIPLLNASLPIIYTILLFLFLSGPRILYRCSKDYAQKFKTNAHVLIIGAGSAGESLARDLRKLRAKGYKPVAFVDDDPQKVGHEIHGIRVKGNCQQIPALVKKLNIKLNVIAVPSANAAQMKKIVFYCNQADIPFCTLPSMQAIGANGELNIKSFAEISLETLLGRKEINLAEEKILAWVRGKIILISGGGGSIGLEVCLQLATLQPKQLIIVDSCEYNLYNIDLQLKNKFPTIIFQSILCSITDRKAMQAIFAKFKPQIIFHAAAYKHVPLLESQLRIAMYNNIIGSRIMAEIAAIHACETFVLISTDKAVNPTNIMGATKRASEIFCQNYNDHVKTKFITVRFGNVLDSAGSVVPLFRKQLKAGGPLTVTHPEITRFFMTIPEASQLIIQSLALGNGGEIFVLDMGEPIKISYLANKLIELSGKVLGKDIQIEYTGLRPGEKLYEELFYLEEELQETTHPKINIASSKKRSWAELTSLLNEIELAYEDYDEARLHELLLLLVPEYKTGHKPPLFVPQISQPTPA